MTNVWYKLDILIQNEIKLHYMLSHNSRKRFKKVIISKNSDEAELGHLYIKKNMTNLLKWIP